MTRRKLGVTWDAGNGVLAASCNDDVLAAAAASGCISLTIGMESGNREILRKVKKPATPEVLLRAAENLRKYPDIFVRVFLMVGFPGETVRMIRDTIELSVKMGLDWHTITQLQGLPNTDIFQDLIKLGIVKKEDTDVRYSLTTYGKSKVNESVREIAGARSAEDVLDSFVQDKVPTPEELQSIWFVMNYVVNFRRIFLEKRAVKLRYLQKFTAHIAETVSPEHAFALYFKGYLDHQLGDQPDPATAARLAAKLAGSRVWDAWFRYFNLSTDDLISGDFSRARPHALGPDAGSRKSA